MMELSVAMMALPMTTAELPVVMAVLPVATVERPMMAQPVAARKAQVLVDWSLVQVPFRFARPSSF